MTAESNDIMTALQSGEICQIQRAYIDSVVQLIGIETELSNLIEDNSNIKSFPICNGVIIGYNKLYACRAELKRSIRIAEHFLRTNYV